jgi:serine/threonine-protein kinase
VSKEERIRFGRYELIERLAIGGMAELYRAVLPGPSGFEKVVAIKKILPDLKRSSKFRKMFLHEGRIMAALDHRNLVQVFEMGEVQDELYMCLEYVNGCDLATIIRKNRGEKKYIESYLAAWIAREICQGLDYVHSLTGFPVWET